MTPWTSADARVRSEAIRLQLLLPHERDAAVDAALNDSDSRIVHLGLTAIGERRRGCSIASSISPRPRTSATWIVCSRSTRSPARDAPSVLEAFLQLSVGGRSLFGRIRLPPKTPVLVAVINALATTWADEPRASGVLAAAARSSIELRQACPRRPDERPGRFLNSFAHSLGVMTLYPEGHPSRKGRSTARSKSSMASLTLAVSCHRFISRGRSGLRPGAAAGAEVVGLGQAAHGRRYSAAGAGAQG